MVEPLAFGFWRGLCGELQPPWLGDLKRVYLQAWVPLSLSTSITGGHSEVRLLKSPTPC